MGPHTTNTRCRQGRQVTASNVTLRHLAFVGTLAIFPMAAHADPPPLEYRGIVLGATAADLRDKMPWFECSSTECRYRPDPVAHCWNGNAVNDDCMREQRDRQQFGPAFAKSITAYLDGTGHIQRFVIVYGQDWYAKLVAAVTSKYGPPTDQSEKTVQNGMGATFDSRTALWKRADGRITIEQRWLDLNSGGVLIESAQAIADDAAAERRKAKEATSKL